MSGESGYSVRGVLNGCMNKGLKMLRVKYETRCEVVKIDYLI